jgi:hypothetical protein
VEDPQRNPLSRLNQGFIVLGRKPIVNPVFSVLHSLEPPFFGDFLSAFGGVMTPNICFPALENEI